MRTSKIVNTKNYIMNKEVAFFCLLLFAFSCKDVQVEKVDFIPLTKKSLAKFEPADGKCILFVGQELEAIGGLEAPYNDGYLDHFDQPGGFTMYTGISPNAESFGYTMKGLDGVWETDDWGDSPSNMTLQMADPDFNDLALAIGFWMTDGNDRKIAAGEHTEMIDRFGEWLKSIAPRPVFLRIGYEFSGSWNNYDRESYLTAYRRIKDRYDEMGITNVAYVWQSHGSDCPMELLESWYPGDDYVDWCSASFFARWREINMIEFARQKGKPVFMAEATPTIGSPTVKTNGKTIETILSNPEQAQQAWDEWFVPFFDSVDDNPDVVKAISYINCHWKSHRMWFDNPTFQDVDARLQTSEMISNKWKAEVSKDKYVSVSWDSGE